MDMVFNIGLTVHIMKVTGSLIKLRVKEHSGTLKEIFIEANLRMTWQMELENMYILMALNIRVNLEMTYKKDKVRKNG